LYKEIKIYKVDFKKMMEERVARAVELFKSGYNCSQSVVAAFADLYGFTEEQALKMASSFGGGIGRMRETCGAACGMFMLAGLQTGATDPKDKEGKAANYKLVQDLAAVFSERNGSLNCGELLGLKKYYAKRPCVKIVEEAARIWAEYLETQKMDSK
jgi:C_GCAxxG_C_C family probable redox protein